MDIEEYCNHLEIVTSGWKTKIYDIINHMDFMFVDNKRKTSDLIDNLLIMMNDLEDRIECLRTTSHSEWTSNKREIIEKIVEIEENYKEATGYIVDYDMNTDLELQ